MNWNAYGNYQSAYSIIGTLTTNPTEYMDDNGKYNIKLEWTTLDGEYYELKFSQTSWIADTGPVQGFEQGTDWPEIVADDFVGLSRHDDDAWCYLDGNADTSEYYCVAQTNRNGPGLIGLRSEDGPPLYCVKMRLYIQIPGINIYIKNQFIYILYLIQKHRL